MNEANMRIQDVSERDFLLSVKSVDDSVPEPVQVHDCHRVISALLIALNVGSIGMFYWADDPWVHPVLTVADDL